MATIITISLDNKSTQPSSVFQLDNDLGMSEGQVSAAFKAVNSASLPMDRLKELLGAPVAYEISSYLKTLQASGIRYDSSLSTNSRQEDRNAAVVLNEILKNPPPELSDPKANEALKKAYGEMIKIFLDEYQKSNTDDESLNKISKALQEKISNVTSGQTNEGDKNSSEADEQSQLEDLFKSLLETLLTTLVETLLDKLLGDGDEESESASSASEVSDSDEGNSDESETDESETDESETDESETDESETDESETDESETDESETDESETDESETDESETDESETDTDLKSSNDKYIFIVNETYKRYPDLHTQIDEKLLQELSEDDYSNNEKYAVAFAAELQKQDPSLYETLEDEFLALNKLEDKNETALVSDDEQNDENVTSETEMVKSSEINNNNEIKNAENINGNEEVEETETETALNNNNSENAYDIFVKHVPGKINMLLPNLYAAIKETVAQDSNQDYLENGKFAQVFTDYLVKNHTDIYQTIKEGFMSKDMFEAYEKTMGLGQETSINAAEANLDIEDVMSISSDTIQELDILTQAIEGHGEQPWLRAEDVSLTNSDNLSFDRINEDPLSGQIVTNGEIV